MTEERLSIEEEQAEFVRDFNELGDWLFQYDCLLELTAGMQPVHPWEKNEDTLIAGCQAKLWVVLEYDGETGNIQIRADSEALIVKGMVAVIVALLHDRTTEEIVQADIDFIEKTALKQQISTDRFHGMQTVIHRIKEYAKANRSSQH